LGFIQAGHKIVWAIDNDPDAVKTYRENIGDHIVESNIEDVDASTIPDADIIIGGFPCQGFSCANMRRTVADSRNSLYIEFLKILREKKPKYFFAENVRGILNLDNGSVIQKITEDFEGAGYVVEVKHLNATDYGVPQNRIRVFIVGSRNDLPKQKRYRFPEPTHSKNPDLLGGKKWLTIEEALKGIPEPDENHNLKNHVCSQYKVTNRNFTGHRTTDPAKPCPTILARGNGKGGVCAIQHHKNHRRLSVRESAIIQTFPRNFVFSGMLNSMYRQVGNAVPVLLARRLAEQLK